MKKDLLPQIKKYEKIIIHRHQKPDGDALGSQFGLQEIIKTKFPKKTVLVVGNNDEYSNNSIKNIFKNKFDSITQKDYVNALVIVVDTANLERVEGIDFYKGEKVFKIDHHKTIENFGDYEWIESSSSSTCEMITRWARENKLEINKQAANYLLTGMITDTGRFMFNSVDANTFEEAHHLLKSGIKISKIVNSLNDRNINFSRLQGFVLSQFQYSNGVSWFVLPKEEHTKFGVDYDTASSLVFLLMSFSEANYAAYVSYDNKNEIWKGSLRSRKKPINQIAEQFDGGGHEMASGFKIKDIKDFDKIVKKLKKL